MFDIIGKRNWYFAFSLLLVIPGLIFILLTPITGGQVGLRFTIDYTGGTRWEIGSSCLSVYCGTTKGFTSSWKPTGELTTRW